MEVNLIENHDSRLRFDNVNLLSSLLFRFLKISASSRGKIGHWMQNPSQYDT